MTYQVFAADVRTVYAVTRCFEIISEASRRLTKEIKGRHPNIPWTDIAGAGNVYRHNYEDVLERQLWATLRHKLDELEAAVAEELRRLDKG
jgi:uncharacterized protein with HEPN domain